MLRDGSIMLLSMVICLAIGVAYCHYFKVSSEIAAAAIGSGSALLGQVIGILIAIFTSKD